MTRGLIVLLVVASCLAPPAQGALLTSSLLDGTPVPGVTSLDFHTYPTEVDTLGPVALTAADGTTVTYTATTPLGIAGFSASQFGLGDNGGWYSKDYPYVFTVGDLQGGLQSTVRFTLSHPVSAIGGFLNYANGSSSAPFDDPGIFAIRAIGADGSILEQYLLESIAPILTLHETDAGAFRGISRSQADIYAFEFRGGGVIRNLEFVPEPPAMLLGLISLLNLAPMARRFRA